MVEAATDQPAKEPVVAPGGLEDADVWGDAPNPLAELESMTDQELQEKIRDMEAEMRRNRQQMTTINNENRRLDARIEENQKRLKQSTQLPHMIATIGELIDVEEEPEEGQEGSGFAVKKTELQK